MEIDFNVTRLKFYRTDSEKTRTKSLRYKKVFMYEHNSLEPLSHETSKH